MNVAVFAAHPTSRDKLRDVAHEPTIGIVIGCSGFAGDGAIQSELEAQSARRAVVDHGSHHFDHFVAGAFGNHFVHARRELGNDVPLAVLDAADQRGGTTDALVDKGRVGRGHFAYRHLARSETQGHRGMNVGIGDPEILHESLQTRTAGIHLAHEVGRGPVARLRESPNEGHHLAGSCAVGIARCPERSAYAVASLRIEHHRLGRVPIFEGHGIDKRLHRRADLSASDHTHIVLEMSIIETSYISFHVTIARIDRNQTGSEEGLVIANGIERCHDRIDIAMVGVDRHGSQGAKGIVNVFLRCARCLHRLISFTLAHGFVEDALHLFGGQTGVEGEVFIVLPLVKLGLKSKCNVTVDRFLGIFLHARVDCGVNFQAVGVDVVV